MNRFITLSFLLFISNTINAQLNIDSLRKPENMMPLVFKKNHWGFTFMAASVNKAKVTGNSFTYNQAANNKVGVQIGLNYQINSTASNSLLTGVGFNILGRNFTYLVTKERFNPVAAKDVSANGIYSNESPIVYLSLPICFEHRWFKKKHFFSALAGAELIVPIQAYSETAAALYNYNGNYIELVQLYTDWEETSNPKIGTLLGVGFGYLTKRNNTKTIRLIAKLSFADLAKSTYTFNIPSQPIVSGTHATNGSYIGLSFSYMFTNANYAIRKLYKKQ
jgi:hypothetical protein